MLGHGPNLRLIANFLNLMVVRLVPTAINLRCGSCRLGPSPNKRNIALPELNVGPWAQPTSNCKFSKFNGSEASAYTSDELTLN